MLSRDEIIERATQVQWDHDELAWVFNAICPCGGKYRMIRFNRDPFDGPHEDRPSATYDVITAECITCGTKEFFPFKPFCIHIYPDEMIKQNAQYVRV